MKYFALKLICQDINLRIVLLGSSIHEENYGWKNYLFSENKISISSYFRKINIFSFYWILADEPGIVRGIWNKYIWNKNFIFFTSEKNRSLRIQILEFVEPKPKF